MSKVVEAYGILLAKPERIRRLGLYGMIILKLILNKQIWRVCGRPFMVQNRVGLQRRL